MPKAFQLATVWVTFPHERIDNGMFELRRKTSRSQRCADQQCDEWCKYMAMLFDQRPCRRLVQLTSWQYLLVVFSISFSKSSELTGSS